MMNLLKSVFDKSLERESQTITIVETGKRFNAFFRINNDGNNKLDTMKIYYRVGSPVHMGDLISYKGNTYLVLNQETAENDVYMKSSVVRANAKITTHDLTVIDLPIFSDGISSIALDTNTNYNTISGIVIAYTADNERSRTLKIDDVFNAYGRTWKISNLFYSDGICTIGMGVTVDVIPDFTYTIEFTEPLTVCHVAPGETAHIAAKVYLNGKSIPDAEIQYRSTLAPIATIDQNGDIEYLRDGSVRFIASYEAQNISVMSANVVIKSAPADDEGGIFVSKISEIAYDFAESLKYYPTIGKVRDNSIPISFSVENIDTTAKNLNSAAKRIKITNHPESGVVDVLVTSSTVFEINSFDFVAFNTEYDIENRQRIKVVSLL